MGWKQIHHNRKMVNGTIYWRCSKGSCPARITTNGDQLLQQTNEHNHPVDPVELCVEEIKSKVCKQEREEVVPIPAMYNDALVELQKYPARCWWCSKRFCPAWITTDRNQLLLCNWLNIQYLKEELQTLGCQLDPHANCDG